MLDKAQLDKRTKPLKMQADRRQRGQMVHLPPRAPGHDFRARGVYPRFSRRPSARPSVSGLFHRSGVCAEREILAPTRWGWGKPHADFFHVKQRFVSASENLSVPEKGVKR